MKKKLLTIAVTAAMVFSLVACGSNGGNSETKAVQQQDFSAQRVWILRTTGMDGLCPFMVLVRTCSD